jgi:hypothetical protein
MQDSNQTSFFIGVNSANNFEPNTHANKFLSVAQLPTGAQRPQAPQNSECFFDQSIATPTLIWADGENNTWRDSKGNSVTCADKLITSFSLLASKNSAITTDVVAVIDGLNISLTVPNGAVVAALKPSFTHSLTSAVAIGVTPQVPGTTANNFTSPITYTVIAQDTTTQDYVVTVTIAPAA